MKSTEEATNDAEPKPGEQAAVWNGPGGQAWVDSQELLDSLLKPFEDRLLEAITPGASKRVLDVGCGTGSTTLAFARKLGASGSATGVDISEPMLALARSRAARERTPPSFVLADAQTHPFEAASFDLVTSRFGVMFFDDAVRAFANLHRATRAGGELRFVAWRSPDENPFMTAAERAAAPLLPDLPARRAGAPGQFALADPDHVRAISRDGGWSDVHLQPIDVPCAMPATALDRYASSLGPVGRALQQVNDEALRARVIEAARAALQPYVHGDEVRFVAACWLVGARA